MSPQKVKAGDIIFYNKLILEVYRHQTMPVKAVLALQNKHPARSYPLVREVSTCVN